MSMGDSGAHRTAGSSRSSTLMIVIGLLIALVASVALGMSLLGGRGAEGTATPTPSVTTSAPEAAAVTTAPAKSTTATKTKTKAASKKTKGTAGGAAATSATETSAAPTTDAAQAPAGAATNLRITSAGVNHPISPQGLAADGTINPGRNQVIWFNGYNRVSPGQVGTSVIAAHVTWEGAPDAFAQLGNVSVGDTVEVGYENGATKTFTVTELRPVDKDTLARSLTVWGPHPANPRLAIITCDTSQGYQSDGHTAANLLVVAEG